VPLLSLAREHGTSSTSCYTWRAKCGRLDAYLMSKMKDTADENHRLKRMHADTMQNDFLKQARRRQKKAFRPPNALCTCQGFAPFHVLV
jgi:hypothetical protein